MYPKKTSWTFYGDEGIAATAVAADLEKAPILALDLETTGLDPKKDNIVLVTLATPEYAHIFLPEHLEVLRPILTDLNRKFLIQHAPFDTGFLYAASSIQFLPHQIYDTRLSERNILDRRGSKESASLGSTVKRYLGVDMNKGLATSFKDHKPGDHFTIDQLEYAAEDALALFPVVLHQAMQIGFQLDSGVGALMDMYDYIDGKRDTLPERR